MKGESTSPIPQRKTVQAEFITRILIIIIIIHFQSQQKKSSDKGFRLQSVAGNMHCLLRKYHVL